MVSGQLEGEGAKLKVRRCLFTHGHQEGVCGIQVITKSGRSSTIGWQERPVETVNDSLGQGRFDQKDSGLAEER